LNFYTHLNLLQRKKYFFIPIFFFVFSIFCLLLVFQESAEAQGPGVNWDRIINLKPDLKVMVLVNSQRPLSLEDLSFLARFGMIPADRDPGLVLGLKKAVFSVKLKNWASNSLPAHLSGRLLDRFFMSGIYRLGFKVEQEGYEGPLTLEITAPRDGFGKQLLSSEFMVRRQAPNRLYIDEVGNRWYRIDYSKIKQGEVIRLHFAFKYLVDMAELLQHDLMLWEKPGEGAVPDEIRPFLNSGHKIDKNLPQAVEWAREGGPRPLDNVRSEYLRVKNFIKKTIPYDTQKKARYFGGKAIYSNLDDMYQDITTTLFQRLGACPDTSLLECAFLRARGIPCRTAGRFGHFLIHLYVPGKGWLSTLIYPTGIPLILAPGPDNVPYQKWNPAIQLRTVTLEAKTRIEAMEDLK